MSVAFAFVLLIAVFAALQALALVLKHPRPRVGPPPRSPPGRLL
jgi:hypothetical protein